jgi:hypothetical protein
MLLRKWIVRETCPVYLADRKHDVDADCMHISDGSSRLLQLVEQPSVPNHLVQRSPPTRDAESSSTSSTEGLESDNSHRPSKRKVTTRSFTDEDLGTSDVDYAPPDEEVSDDDLFEEETAEHVTTDDEVMERSSGDAERASNGNTKP